MLLLGVIFPLLCKICLDVHDESVFRCGSILMHEHTGTLVEEQNVFILVNDIQFGLDAQKRAVILLGGSKKLLPNKQLDLVPLAKHIVLLCAHTVDLDLFGANVLVHQGKRKSFDRLGQKLVQALSRIVLFYCDLLHENPLFARF